jgi:hypothetical protein
LCVRVGLCHSPNRSVVLLGVGLHFLQQQVVPSLFFFLDELLADALMALVGVSEGGLFLDEGEDELGVVEQLVAERRPRDVHSLIC